MKRLRGKLGWIVGLLFSAGSHAATELRPNPTAPTNLVAWCIVPFDSVRRGPEERAAMLERLGFSQLAYDWRAEHIPSFDAEVAALQRHHVFLRAWWFPATLNAEAESILACIRRHGIHPELWVVAGEPIGADHAAKVRAAADGLLPVVKAAAEAGCKVGLYNHGGWFGEPENQLAIRARLVELGYANVGLVYNFHHGHDQLDRLPTVFPRMLPHLLSVNLNGTEWDGERRGRKIIPFGSGEYDLAILQLLRRSGYAGPVGILGHTEEDAELKLTKDLAGLHRVEARLNSGESAPWPPAGRKHEPAAVTAAAPTAIPLTGPERFGGVLDARGSAGRVFAGLADFRRAPLTLDAWARFQSKQNYNILLASEAKGAATHWELYTHAGTGYLAFYLPGSTPTGANSSVDICDGRWHHVAAQVTATQVRLFVDGKSVAESAVQSGAEATGGAAQFALGRLVEGGLGCDGWLDDVRIRRGIHSIDATTAVAEATEKSTLALWRFESAAELAAWPAATTVPAIGETRVTRQSSLPAMEAGTPKVSGQEPSVQKEQDWVDNRWSQMDVGPAFASNLVLPEGGVIAKALTLQLPGEPRQCVAYDLATGALRAAWTGGFLRFDAARFGLMGGQKPATTPWFLNRSKAGFPGAQYRFLGYRQQGAEVVLEHEVNGVKFEESVRVMGSGTGFRLQRSFGAGPSEQPIQIALAPSGDGPLEKPADAERNRVAWTAGDVRREISVAASAGSLERSADGEIRWTLAPHQNRRVAAVTLDQNHPLPPPTMAELATEPSARLKPSTGSGKPAPRVLITRGQRGADSDILAVDTLTMPYDNPDHALLFGAGVDLAADGSAYVCTMHGDVWHVTGIDDSLKELKWVRYATGLFQPLGLKVRDGKVFVLGRDRITRLEDTDGDGVADFYANFHDAIQTSTGGHDYVTCLEQDQAGYFYYSDPLGLHRVSSDGRSTSLLAAGFRNPNGIGVSPDGRVLTIAPQQGTRTPSSGIWEVHPEIPGLWGGYPEPRINAQRPLGYDAPLCWIPHGVDNSSGSQVWVPPGKWGPLGGQMLHLLWGRCGLMLVLRDTTNGHQNGLVVPLPAKFLAGPNRGSFFGNDLFVAGSTGWQTSAVRDGSLQRVRWTGKRFLQPVAWQARKNGLDLTFAEPLRRDTASDTGSFSVKRWNYRYSADYGSKDWSAANPNHEGRDEVPVSAVTLSADGRTISLNLGEFHPVMQFEVKYNLDAADGKPVRGSVWGTINP